MQLSIKKIFLCYIVHLGRLLPGYFGSAKGSAKGNAKGSIKDSIKGIGKSGGEANGKGGSKQVPEPIKAASYALITLSITSDLTTILDQTNGSSTYWSLRY
jgi:hypothetical protein